MKLPFLSQKKENKEFFLTLLLSFGKISSILFEKSGSKLLILGASSKEFEGSLDALSSQKLLELSDIVISGVEAHLPEGENFSKTIFAVPHSWVFEGKIVKEKLANLKTLCDELRLTPVGFVVSIEAIIAYLHRKEGAPVTAIFAEVGANHVAVSIVKNGSMLGVFEAPLEDNAAKTIDSLLLSQNVVDVLPPKIILLNFEHAKKIQQSVLTHAWSKSLSFLHIPQVEVLDQEIESQAVIAGVSSQMGFADIPDIHMKALETTHVPLEIASSEQITPDERVGEKNTSENVSDVPENTSSHTDEPVEVKSEEFGFFRDKDVLQEEIGNVSTKEDNLENKDQKHEELHVKEKQQSDVEEFIPEDEQNNKQRFSLPGIKLPNILMPNLSNLNMKGRGPILYPIVVVVVIVAIVAAYYLFYEKAEVVVVLDKREVAKEESVVFSLDNQTSVSEKVIKIDQKEVKVEGSEESFATGIKETGEKSKGEVVIYNKTEDKKTFPKGSVLVGPNNLLFTLTDEVSVASTSSFSTTFSNAKGKVEASKFGKEYNIPSGTNFSFENISTANFFAKNESAFSGGTKKEIKVVSNEDISKVTSKIVSNLTKKALDQETASADSGNQFLPQALEYSFDEKNFSKEEGDEASSISLTAVLALTLGYIKTDEISAFAKEAGGSDVPSTYMYSSKDSKVKIEDIDINKKGDFVGKIIMSSVFLPNVSTQEFSQKLVGKSQGKVSEIITGDGISDTQVIFTRSISFMPKILPFNKENIMISTRVE